MTISTMNTIRAMVGPCAHIAIKSGEGDGPGTVEWLTAGVTVIGIKRALTKSRCGGSRWARALALTHHSGGVEYGIDLETAEEYVPIRRIPNE